MRNDHSGSVAMPNDEETSDWAAEWPRPNRGGRPKGALNKVTREARDFALCITRDVEYRENLMDRARDGTLAPAVETMLWAYAHGRPPVQVTVEHEGSDDLAQLTAEELADRATRLAQRLKPPPRALPPATGMEGTVIEGTACAVQDAAEQPGAED